MASPKGEPENRPVRFYSEVTTAEMDGRWAVQLDGRRLRTPAGAALLLPTRALGALVANDWQRQGERLDIVGMIATRLANAAIDRTPQLRSEMAAEAARYAETDLVCYLAEHPNELRQRQADVWGPMRDWCAVTYGVRLHAVEGVMPHAQPRDSIEALRTHVGALDDFEVTGLLFAIGLLGSAVLGLALASGTLSAEEAHAAARLDEAFQASQWGEDAEALARAAQRLSETQMAEAWFQALRAEDGGSA